MLLVLQVTGSACYQPGSINAQKMRRDAAFTVLTKLLEMCYISYLVILQVISCDLMCNSFRYRIQWYIEIIS